MPATRLAPFLLIAAFFAAPTLAFDMTSPAFTDGGTLPSSAVFEGFGCHGPNRSPALNWSSPPPATKSLAVTVYDPDAPTGSGWWHWVVFDLPPGTRRLPEGAAAASLPMGAVEGNTDWGTPGFGGACPPAGDKPHRYVFTVYALDIAHLPGDAKVPAAQIGYQLYAHSLASSAITATYGR